MSLNRTQNEELKHSSSMTERQIEVNKDDNCKDFLIMRAHKNMQNRRSYNYTFSDKLYNIW